MPPSDGLQHLVLQGLGVDGDAAHAAGLQDLQLFLGNGVRPSGLHGVLGAGRQGQLLPAGGQNTVQLRGAQHRGSAAAHVKGAHLQAEPAQYRCRRVQLLQQQLHIGIHQLEGFPHIRADKRAVGAAGGTEGDAHVDRDLVRGQGQLRRPAGLGAVHRHLGPHGGDVIALLQAGLGLFWGKPLPQVTGGQLYGPHAGQRPPGQLPAQKGGPRLVEGQLQGPRQLPVAWLLEGTAAQGLPALPDHPRGHRVVLQGKGGAVLPRLGRRFGVFGVLAGEEGEHHLLRRVLVGGKRRSQHIKLHKIISALPERTHCLCAPGPW